ncbi:MAG: PfkB family carbohydrate kinase, partial [Spirochaetota bacterium]
SGDRKFIYHIADAAAGSIEMPPAGRLEGVKLFHVMGCSLMVNRNTRRVIEGVAECVKSQGGLISYDPNIRPELLKEESIGEVTGTIMGMTDIFLPGEKELLQAAGKSTVDEALEQALDAGASAVVLKKGREGARFVSRQSDILVKPYSIEEVDPTGAGDAFDAGFVCGYLEGLGPEQALLLAGACGALNASYLGPMEGVFHRNYVDYFIGK